MLIFVPYLFLLLQPQTVVCGQNVTAYLTYPFYTVSVLSGYQFQDISTSGILSSTSNENDDPLQSVNLHFNFPFFGHLQNNVLLSPNGYLGITVETACTTGFCGWNTEVLYERYIAPLMTDLDPGMYSKSAIYYKLVAGTNPHAIFQWNNVYLWNTTIDPSEPGYTFQVVIYPSGNIQFNYQTVSTLPNAVYNDYYKKNYPLYLGLEDAVLVSLQGYTVLEPYAPATVNPSWVTSQSSVSFVPSQTCASIKDCYTCLTKTFTPNALKCGWCHSGRMCADAIGREVSEPLLPCPSLASLQYDALQCADSPGNLAGIIIGTFIGFTLIVAVCVVGIKQFKRYIKDVGERMGGKTGDELPQLPPSSFSSNPHQIEEDEKGKEKA